MERKEGVRGPSNEFKVGACDRAIECLTPTRHLSPYLRIHSIGSFIGEAGSPGLGERKQESLTGNGLLLVLPRSMK